MWALSGCRVKKCSLGSFTEGMGPQQPSSLTNLDPGWDENAVALPFLSVVHGFLEQVIPLCTLPFNPAAQWGLTAYQPGYDTRSQK